MKLHMFTVFDVKAKAYLPPFFLPQVGQAVRSFGDAIDDPAHAFAKHPEDYTLFLVGTFDDASGVVALEGALQVVARAHELKALMAKERSAA